MRKRTLGELIEKKHSGFQLAVGYYIERLIPGCIGFLPAIESKSNNQIITADLKLLKKVWELLPPCRSRLYKRIIYANIEKGIAYYVSELMSDSLENMPFQILTQVRFKKLLENSCLPFKWAFTNPVNYIPKKEFLEIIKSAN